MKNVEIEVRSTDDLKELSYLVIGSGTLIESQTISTPRTKHYVLSVSPKDEMSPKCQVIISYIASNGELISDKVDIEFENELNNKVSFV